MPPLVALVLVLAGCGGDDDEPSPAEVRAEQIRDALAGSDLSPEVVDVLALAAGGTDRTYRVAYELATTDGDVQRVELTQRPQTVASRSRTPTAPPMPPSPPTALSTSAISMAPGRAPRWPRPTRWAGAGSLDPEAVARLAGALARGVERYDLGVEHRDLVGVRATCLVTRLRAGVEPEPDEGTEGTLCVSAEGAVLLTERPNDVLRAVDYAADVEDGAFELPA